MGSKESDMPEQLGTDLPGGEEAGPLPPLPTLLPCMQPGSCGAGS